jgi:thiamine-monophosphate kinase
MNTRAPEFELIAAFTAGLPHPPPPRGPGDDAAVLPPSKLSTVVTSDAVVEGVHFTRPAFTLADIGHKALAVNLSDLAAMGAQPTWWLCALAVPPRFSKADARQLARGMAPLARAHGLQLIGGNVSGSPVLSVTLTLAGQTARPLLRSGARPGDWLYVAGTLGEAAAGFAQLSRQGSAADARLVRRQKRPTPLVEVARAAAPYVHAASDVSDGLLQDLAHLCTASQVGVALEGAALKPSPALFRAAGRVEAQRLQLEGGEDYALLFAVPPKAEAAFRRALRGSREPLQRLGRFTRQRGLTLDGVVARPRGFSHL